MQALKSHGSDKSLEHIPFGSPVEDIMAIIDRDGGVILDGVLSPDEVDRLNGELDPYLSGYHTGAMGGDEVIREFWGALTKRVTNAVTLSETYRKRVLERPELWGYVDAMFKGVSNSFWVQATQIIEIMPGEDEQVLHRDMGNYPVFLQYGPQAPEVTCNGLLALVDVTEEIGATRIIPGSHKWDFDIECSQDMTIPAEMKAGSMLFYSGKLVHGGGANVSRDTPRRVIATAFNPSFLVPEEAYPFVVPIEIVRTMPERLQQALGFRSVYQTEPRGGSLWQHNYEELAHYLKL